MLRKIFTSLMLLASLTFSLGTSSAQEPLIDLKALVGKKAIVQRMPLYEPGTFKPIPNSYAGQEVTITGFKPFAMPKIPLEGLSPQQKAVLADIQNAGTLLVQFADGTKADTGKVRPSMLLNYLEPEEGSSATDAHPSGPSQPITNPPQPPVTNEAAQINSAEADSKPALSATLNAPEPVGAAASGAQSTDHLSDAEIAAAIAARPDTGFVYIEDMGFSTTFSCKAQMPSEAVFTPSGWINAQSINAKKQYLPFRPTPDDTLRVLTIVSKGCANGTAAGPVCDTISRVALLSDKGGSVVVEAIGQHPLTQSWQNGYGAQAVCSGLVSQFSLADVQKLRNGKGEFLIATFNGTQLLKTWTVKEKHIKKLGL